MTSRRVLVGFSLIVVVGCKKPGGTSAVKGDGADSASQSTQVTSIEVSFPFTLNSDYSEEIATGGAASFYYTQKNRFSAKSQEALGTVEDLLGASANDQALAVEKVKELLLSKDAWIANKNVSVSYKVRIDEFSGLQPRADTELYNRPIIVGAVVHGGSGSSSWDCQIGYTGNSLRACTSDNEDIKQQILKLRAGKVAEYRKKR